MTISIVDYTTYADVRAALGVSAKELPDETIALDLYSSNLELELYDLDSTAQASYNTLVTKTTPSAAESRFVAAAKFFAIYCVARHLTTTMPIFAPRQISDGKASVVRFDNLYRDTIASVNQMYDLSRNRLTDALGAIGTTVATKVSLNYLGVVTPDYDPVTNE